MNSRQLVLALLWMKAVPLEVYRKRRIKVKRLNRPFRLHRNLQI